MVIYEMMTLKRPFEDIANMFELSVIAESGKVPTLPQEVSTKYKAIIPFWEKCLAVEPEMRPTVKMAKEILAKIL